ncbi:hypothetical protein ABIE26_000143 [Pedobacter africanus]|uniref:Uncharacterized protein n=1 Tax=Pedobacter africanus TaxID=151894 RepID=A0ACC6KVK6_9SPHI|nr:hypothetical protein [Pedobacter africanus]
MFSDDCGLEFLSFNINNTIREIIGIKNEIKNQNQNFLPSCLASNPAAICGKRIMGSKKDSNISIMMLNMCTTKIVKQKY